MFSNICLIILNSGLFGSNLKSLDGSCAFTSLLAITETCAIALSTGRHFYAIN